MKTLAKGPQPAKGGVRVDMLKGNDYVRVWINRGGTNYIIHLPPVGITSTRGYAGRRDLQVRLYAFRRRVCRPGARVSTY